MRNAARLFMSLPLLLALSLYMYGQGASTGGSTGGAGQGGNAGNTQGGAAAGGSNQDTQSDLGTGNPQGAVRGNAKSGTHKGKKTIKGCVQSSGGQYMIQEDNGQTARLTGLDMSSYVGQEVKVRGSYEPSASAGMSGSAGRTGNNSADASAGVSGSGVTRSCWW